MRTQYSYRTCLPATSQRLTQPTAADVADVADYPTLPDRLRMGRIAHARTSR